jgi:hypothetical protein
LPTRQVPCENAEVRLSEKTIEVNFCSQMSRHLNAPAWWFGLTQRQERIAGWDVAANITGRWVRFQLKASNWVLLDGRRRFLGHHDQLAVLRARASVKHPIYYVLPTIGTTQELIAANFDLLPLLRHFNVCGLPVNIPRPTTNWGTERANGMHYFDLSPDNQCLTIHSDPIEIGTLSTEEMLAELAREVRGDVEITDSQAEAEEIQGWLRSTDHGVALFLPNN